jgi:N4-gp56 family major capsid protein
MALNQFIPAIWSARILKKLEKNLVFGQPGVVNTDYQGEITAFGDRVHVHSFADLTIGDYVKNTTTIAYELLNDSRVTLVIDQSKYFAFRVDDVDQAQQHPKIIDAASARASYQLAETADRYLSGRYTEAAAGNIIAASQFTAANVYTKFVELSVKMDEGNVPSEGRFAIVPPWVAGLLQQNSSFLSAQPETVLNGAIGQVAGISILKSNNVVATGTSPVVHHIVAGVADAWSFAQQIASVEALRLEGSFADGVRGLHLYGGKVLIPELLYDVRANV